METANKPVHRMKNEKKKSVEKRHSQDSDAVFTNDISSVTPLETASRKSILSDADKVVGSNKPSLKSQSSVGSYSASLDIEETVVEVNISDSYQVPKSEKQVRRKRNRILSSETTWAKINLFYYIFVFISNNIQTIFRFTGSRDRLYLTNLSVCCQFVPLLAYMQR